MDPIAYLTFEREKYQIITHHYCCLSYNFQMFVKVGVAALNPNPKGSKSVFLIPIRKKVGKKNTVR
jgi:hypothetical protein